MAGFSVAHELLPLDGMATRGSPRDGGLHPLHPPILSAIIGGLAATSLMTPVAYLAPVFHLQDLDFAAMIGSLVSSQTVAPVSGTWLLGMLLHFVNGSLVFPLIYVFLVYPRLPGPAWLRGAAYGVALWLMAQAVVMPLAGVGFFSTAKPRPLAALVWSLGTHLLYGVVLGAIATRRLARAIERDARDEIQPAA